MLPSLQPGDGVEIIAPASRCEPERLIQMQALFTDWKLQVRIDPAMFGDDLLCANTDAYRLQALTRALQDPEIKAVICARGGYGSMRLLPDLQNITPPAQPKWFVGMSDVTAIHLYLQQQWKWPVLHASLSPTKCAPAALAEARALLFGETPELRWQAVPLNEAARLLSTPLTGTVTGGNLTLVQASLATFWQLQGRDQFIFLEEVGERGYRVDRMLEHLLQANTFSSARAVILGDFLSGEEPNGRSLLQPILQRFAQRLSIPVVQIQQVGHGWENRPLPLGTSARLKPVGDTLYLVVQAPCDVVESSPRG